MKTIIAAVALVIALPAAANAQSVDSQSAHANHGQDHAQHEGMDHGKEHKDCCEHKNADGTPMDCCKPAKDGKAMACCAKHEKQQADHSGHANH